MPRKARRAQLLEAALEVFVAHGYHAAAMDDIADRAGVSKPVLYQHFPGKLDLYLALLDTSCSTIIEGCRSALARSEEHTSELQSLMRISYAVFCLNKKNHTQDQPPQQQTKHTRKHTNN